MGCISCKTIKIDAFDRNLRGKARLPGIPMKEKKNRLFLFKNLALVTKKSKETNTVKLVEDKAKILKQLDEENITSKMASGGVAYDIPEDNDGSGKAKPACPQRIVERLNRPSTALEFNAEEKMLLADCLKTECLQEKIRQARKSEERRLLAESNREKALKETARKLEMKIKAREEKLKREKENKEQTIDENNILKYERQQQARARRENVKYENAVPTGEDFKQQKDRLLGPYRNGNDTGLPGVDV